MISEIDLDGVFVPALLLAAGYALCITTAVRWSLRRVKFYRFVWHAGLFDVSLFMAILWGIAQVTETLSTHGVL